MKKKGRVSGGGAAKVSKHSQRVRLAFNRGRADVEVQNKAVNGVKALSNGTSRAASVDTVDSGPSKGKSKGRKK